MLGIVSPCNRKESDFGLIDIMFAEYHWRQGRLQVLEYYREMFKTVNLNRKYLQTWNRLSVTVKEDYF